MPTEVGGASAGLSGTFRRRVYVPGQGGDRDAGMSITKKLEGLARKGLPPSGARLAKRLSVGPRFHAQLAAARKGYRAFGQRYEHPVLFIAGLPKSGTTWLEKMIQAWEGYHEVLIPEVAGHELATGGSHDFELPADMFSRFSNALVLTKMHVHGSPHNVSVLHGANVPYVVLFRDLRDVAVSHYFYVRNTPWHPEYPVYAGLDVEAGLCAFAERTLGAFRDWVISWETNRDPERSVVIRYEQMLEDGVGTLSKVAGVFGLPGDDARIREVIEAHSFERMSGGRSEGQEDAGQFVRKGTSGDWRNHFSDRVREMFKREIGSFLIERGYEHDERW